MKKFTIAWRVTGKRCSGYGSVLKDTCEFNFRRVSELQKLKCENLRAERASVSRVRWVIKTNSFKTKIQFIPLRNSSYRLSFEEILSNF